MRAIRTFLALTKFPICGLSTLSAATGSIAFARSPSPAILTAPLGVLLLALGACALNEWQERDLDARMERTRGRPLPSGALRPGLALALAAGSVLGGFLILWLVRGSLPAALLGLLAVLWYNGVYTPLKRLTAFAVIPGALIGALPPSIGWVAAGGRVLDPHVLALSFFFFVWQVPHFWLLLAPYGEDYEKAGFPTLARIFSARQLARLVFLWMLAAAVSSLLLPIYGLVVSPYVSMGLLAAGLGLAAAAAMVLRGGGSRASFRLAFRWINLYALAVMGLIALDAVA